MNRIFTTAVAASIAGAAANTSPIITDDAMDVISSYLSSAERFALFLGRRLPARIQKLDDLPRPALSDALSYSNHLDFVNLAIALEPRLAFLLRASQGFRTDAEAIEDFVQYNRPELDEALTTSKDSSHTVSVAAEQVILGYLACLERPLCKYLPAYFRDPVRSAELFTSGEFRAIPDDAPLRDGHMLQFDLQFMLEPQPFSEYAHLDAGHPTISSEIVKRHILVVKKAGESVVLSRPRWHFDRSMPPAIDVFGWDMVNRVISIRDQAGIVETSAGSVRSIATRHAEYSNTLERMGMFTALSFPGLGMVIRPGGGVTAYTRFNQRQARLFR